MYVADALSRAPEPREYVGDHSQLHDEHINTLLSYMIPGKSSQVKYAAATAANPLMVGQLVSKTA